MLHTPYGKVSILMSNNARAEVNVDEIEWSAVNGMAIGSISGGWLRMLVGRNGLVIDAESMG